MSAITMRRIFRTAVATPVAMVLIAVGAVFGFIGAFVVLLMAPLVAVRHPTFAAIRAISDVIHSLERWAFWNSECAECHGRRMVEKRESGLHVETDYVEAHK